MDEDGESIAFSSDLEFESDKEEGLRSEPVSENSIQVDEAENGGEEEEEEERQAASIKIDMSKLTKRQRSLYYNEQVELMDIDSVENEGKAVKSQENQLRRSEKARRKKHQTEIKLETTKQATIDKLLNRSVKKRKSAVQAETTPSQAEASVVPPGVYRYVDSAKFPFAFLIIQSGDEKGFANNEICMKQSCLICKNESKYATKAGIRVCSLDCYRLANQMEA